MDREVDRQLAELLADPAYAKVLRRLAGEASRRWHITLEDARRSVLSAIGEPTTLQRIHEAVRHARATGNLGYPTVITRNSLLKLLCKDAVRPRHHPLPSVEQDLDIDQTWTSLSSPSEEEPLAQLQDLQARGQVRRVLAEFATKNRVSARQANLLRRRLLDGVSYEDLAAELKSNYTALRSRFHAAKRRFLQYVNDHHPELRELLAHWGR